MKKATTLIVLMIISGVRLSLCKVEDNELIIKNESVTDTLLVSVRPMGFIFAGDKSYRPNSQWEENNQVFLFGGKKKIFNDVVNPHNERFSLNHDCNSLPATGNGSIGYGKYKIIISVSILDTNGIHYFFPIDSLTIDYSDIDYPFGPSTQWPNFSNDFLLYYYNQDSILAEFKCGNCQKFNLDTTGREFEVWNQFVNIDSVYSKSRNSFGFISNPDFTTYPIFSDKYTAIQHDDYGSLYVDFNLNHSATIMDTLLHYPTSIVIGKHAAMKIAAGRTFDMITPSNTGDSAYTDLVVGDSAFLILYGGSRLIVQAPNRLTLTSGSSLTLALNSAIVFKPGSTFCNKGGRINGFSNGMIFEKGLHGFPCALESPIVIDDSCKFVLNDSAVISLPDNFTLHLSGNETSLILNPGSKLLFGENSGIVCDSGARLIANNATFASVDSAKKWNGISLNDPSHDTIRNCTIKNAMYGIALSGKYDPDESPEPYSTEISGCSFLNTTSYVLNNGIYLEGSAHVLLKDNTVSATNLSIGFTHGIYAEYCPGEMLIFVSNNISNCNNGMTIIQSSPYIAFNMLSGNSYGESGLFLDNSNGTIKYNVISDFYYSYYSFYSSPDLLKNTFDNSCDDNVYLSSSSVPVMHPLVSGGSTYWFAGDNHITGSPYDAGILFDEDAYPDLNYGYNRFTLSGSSYYISGINPAEGSREFYAVQNYWQDVPPDNSGAGTYVQALGRQHNASGRKS